MGTCPYFHYLKFASTNWETFKCHHAHESWEVNSRIPMQFLALIQVSKYSQHMSFKSDKSSWSAAWFKNITLNLRPFVATAWNLCSNNVSTYHNPDEGSEMNKELKILRQLTVNSICWKCYTQLTVNNIHTWNGRATMQHSSWMRLWSMTPDWLHQC